MSKTFLTDWTQHAYETVMAANPYGCNQYGEGWKKPHDGTSTSRGADGKKRVKTSGNTQNSVDSGGEKSVNAGGMNKDTEQKEESELNRVKEKLANIYYEINRIREKARGRGYGFLSSEEAKKIQELNIQKDELNARYVELRSKEH